LSARLDPERGETVCSALAAVAKAEKLTSTDALVRLAEIGLAALADGPGLPAAVLERLACIGRVQLAVRAGGKAHSDVHG
jgi:hypothetical protein